jgi:hypothetical protein
VLCNLTLPVLARFVNERQGQPSHGQEAGPERKRWQRDMMNSYQFSQS